MDTSRVTVDAANVGLSLPAVQLIHAYFKFGGGRQVGQAAVRADHALVTFLSQVEGPKLRLHSQLIQPVLAANKDDITWMEGRLGESLQEDLDAHDSHAGAARVGLPR